VKPEKVKVQQVHRLGAHAAGTSDTAMDLAPPQYASRFTVKLRVQRETWFYIIQVFGLTILITIASMLPLCIPPTDGFIGDRLSLYAGGVLTLTSFKYSIADHLPSVPYSTKFDKVLLVEFVCLCACAAESLIAYRVVSADGAEDETDFDHFWDRGEDVCFIVLAILWSLGWLALAGGKLGLPRWMTVRPHDWLHILDNQDWQADNDELEKLELRAEKEELNTLTRQLEELNAAISEQRQKIAEATEKNSNTKELSETLAELQHKRGQLDHKYKQILEYKNQNGKLN